MMKRRAIGTLALLATLPFTASNIAIAGERFAATLSGAQEVREVVTDTTGRIKVKFNNAFSRAEFKLNVRNGNAITQAHLHCGLAGMDGSVVAFLFGPVSVGVDFDGRLSEGTLMNADIIERDCVGAPINNIASLAQAMRAGRIYVNVHSVANGPGEIRGQLLRTNDRKHKDDREDDDDDD